jgi:ribonuclease D
MSETNAHFWIDSETALNTMVNQLQRCSNLTLDTEYDSFKRSYGFKALLIQVFDGKKVYIIDPLSDLDLRPLWNIIEDKNIRKILYSGSEDIALLKAMGCSIQNVFDVQVAATLCNHPARNLGGLIETETGKLLDKSQQQSDWSKRPLSDAQLSYAANDVIHLPQIADKLIREVASRGLLHVLQTENNALEHIEERSHVPKLKPYHFRLHSDAFCESLLQLLQWREGITSSTMHTAPTLRAASQVVCCASAVHQNQINTIQQLTEDYNTLKKSMDGGEFRTEESRKRKEMEPSSSTTMGVWEQLENMCKTY